MEITLHIRSLSRPELLGLCRLLVEVGHSACLAAAEALLEEQDLRQIGEDPGDVTFELPPLPDDEGVDEVAAELAAAAQALARRGAECFRRPVLRALAEPLGDVSAALAAEAARLRQQSEVLDRLTGT